MVQEPRIELSVDSAQHWQVVGPLEDRIEAAANCWRRFHNLARLPQCRVSLDRAPPQHVGLGVGTQLALSVGAGLSAYCGLPVSAPAELAQSVGRGRRSAIGTYGFAYGGLILEHGKLPSEPISPLDTRLNLPDSWRFVLLRPLNMRGLSGDSECAVMEKQSVDPAVTSELIRMVREELVPAVATGEFGAFASTLYRYGHLAGSIYAEQQGGSYNGPVLTSLVDRIRSWGYDGIGQSSWGPTLFVAQPDQDSADHLAERLHRECGEFMLDVVIAKADNHGARIAVTGAEPN